MNSNSELKIGIIGFGEMGRRHALEYYHATQGKLNCVAVVEPEDRRYQEGCEWFGRKPQHYRSIGEMLTHETLDGLIISSPNCCHLENLRECQAAGLPLILEKPLESSFEKICNIVRQTHAYQAPIMVDHVMRYAPIIQKAKQLISSGAIGKVCSFNLVQYHSGHALFTTFRRTLSGGGGQLIEKATHDFDTIFYLCGIAPRRVSGICRQQKFGGDKPEDLTCSACNDFSCANRVFVGMNANSAVKDISLSHDLCSFAKVIDAYDNEMCLLECTHDVFGVYSHCYFVNNHFSRRYEIIGTEGMLYIELTMRDKPINCDGRITVARYAPTQPLAGLEEYRFDYEDRIHYNGGPFAGRHFYAMIQGKAEPFTTVDDAFAAEMVGIAAMKSSQEHRWIDIEEEVVPADLRLVFHRAYSNY